MDGASTAWALAALGSLFGMCLWGERRPPRPGRPKLFPYVPVMMICLVLILGLLAHAVSLATGTPVLPRGI